MVVLGIGVCGWGLGLEFWGWGFQLMGFGASGEGLLGLGLSILKNKTMQTKDFSLFVCDESVDGIGGVVILLMLLL